MCVFSYENNHAFKVCYLSDNKYLSLNILKCEMNVMFSDT